MLRPGTLRVSQRPEGPPHISLAASEVARAFGEQNYVYSSMTGTLILHGDIGKWHERLLGRRKESRKDRFIMLAVVKSLDRSDSPEAVTQAEKAQTLLIRQPVAGNPRTRPAISPPAGVPAVGSILRWFDCRNNYFPSELRPWPAPR
jgi:hypothetical protein